MRKPRFALAFDPQAALAALGKDALIGPLIRRCGAFTLAPEGPPTPFEALAEAITHQQLHARAAQAIFGRLRDALPSPMTPHDLLGASDATLRGAGLSSAKTLALRDLAAHAEEGQIPSWQVLRGMEDEAILQRLTRVRGVGRWTVEMLLIFRLGRPDVWPVDDFAVRKAYCQLTSLERVTPGALRQAGEAWRPWRTVVAWYLWKHLETA